MRPRPRSNRSSQAHLEARRVGSTSRVLRVAPVQRLNPRCTTCLGRAGGQLWALFLSPSLFRQNLGTDTRKFSSAAGCAAVVLWKLFAMLSRSTRVLHRAARRLPRRNLSTLADSSESVQEQFDPANPTAEHRALRKMVQEFTKNEVEPQALQYNREERLNRALFERAGELGLLGVTADPEYGGAGMDATAACIVHEVPPVGP